MFVTCPAGALSAIFRDVFADFAFLALRKPGDGGDGTTIPLPKLDFGPLINSKKVEEMRVLYVDALSKGAISLFEGTVAGEHEFSPGRTISSLCGPGGAA